MLKLLTKAISSCDDSGTPSKPIWWKSESNPLGRTYFTRFGQSEVKELKNSRGFVTGYSVNVWLNDCGHVYNTIWKFDYFESQCGGNGLKAIKQIAHRKRK